MSVTNGVVFDGRERREVPVKADLVSRITVNDVPVTGPRAKVRMTFKTGAQPILLHRGLWERLEFAGELRVADEERVHAGVLDRLGDRRGGSPRSRILRTRLAYHAAEYTGGPDLLAPSYFVEVEHRAPGGDGQQRQQPRQVIRVPA
jgi:hypothetical protein